MHVGRPFPIEQHVGAEQHIYLTNVLSEQCKRRFSLELSGVLVTTVFFRVGAHLTRFADAVRNLLCQFETDGRS
jgi:hypothetical protein